MKIEVKALSDYILLSYAMLEQGRLYQIYSNDPLPSANGMICVKHMNELIALSPAIRTISVDYAKTLQFMLCPSGLTITIKQE